MSENAQGKDLLVAKIFPINAGVARSELIQDETVRQTQCGSFVTYALGQTCANRIQTMVVNRNTTRRWDLKVEGTGASSEEIRGLGLPA